MFGGNCAIMSSNVKQTVIKKTAKQPMNTGIKMHHHFIVSGRVDKANSQNFFITAQESQNPYYY